MLLQTYNHISPVICGREQTNIYKMCKLCYIKIKEGK